MNKRQVVAFSFIFACCMVMTADIVTYHLTGNHLMQRSKGTVAVLQRNACSTQPMPKRPATTDPQLKVLTEYEQACHSAFANDLMIFTDMPVSMTEAQRNADAMALRLKAFSQQQIMPIVIVEPTSNEGLIDFHEYALGHYDVWNKAYFDRLRFDGITGKQMGLWIPFPEPQQENWKNNQDPDDFAHSINRYFAIVKSRFPGAKTGILLDSGVESQTVPQLLAYTRLIDNSLVDVAGLQGFPWYPTNPDDTRTPITSASRFVPARLAERIARSLGTHQILINTGSFRHKRLTDGGELAVPTAVREATLDSVIDQVQAMNRHHYQVTVNIFAEDKLKTPEGADWSYWQRGDYDLSGATALFTRFVHQLKAHSAQVSIYDTRE